MPRTKIQRFVEELKAPPPNYLHELFSRYMKHQKITSADIGSILGCTDANVRFLLNRPSDKWTLADIKAISGAIGIPDEEILEALELALRNKKSAPIGAGTPTRASTRKAGNSKP